MGTKKTKAMLEQELEELTLTYRELKTSYAQLFEEKIEAHKQLDIARANTEAVRSQLEAERARTIWNLAKEKIRKGLS